MLDIKHSIVGIKARPDSGYKFAGTGFLVQGGFILTCAHVVEKADRNDGLWRFQFEEGDKYIKTARLVQSDRILDIAVLQPVEPLQDRPALPLKSSTHCEGHAFSTFGYPQHGNYDGLHGTGEILGGVTDKQKRRALQFRSTQVTHGFSGCPLWDKELQAVVGMVSDGFDLDLDQPLGGTGFAVPSEVLKDFFAPPPPVTWNLKHPYGQQPNFTGRTTEQEQLSQWLTAEPQNPLLIVKALGGFGKSSLTWHWLMHKVSYENFKYVLWWSFYEGDASFESFVTEALRYLLRSDEQLPAGARPQAERLLKELGQRSDVLLILDGFERTLRIFSGMHSPNQSDFEVPISDTEDDRDCVSLIARTFLHDLVSLGSVVKSKVLMTSRLRPHVLEKHNGLLAGFKEIELKELPPEDALTFFQTQGIQGRPAEIKVVCAHYGYHPLSLRLLAGIIANHIEFPDDINAVQSLEIFDDIKQNQHHVLEVAYNSLSLLPKNLLNRLACFRSSSSMSYVAIKTVSELPEKTLNLHLHDLITRGLLQRSQSSFDLHPIVRHYAYSHFEKRDRRKTHKQLVKYFKSTPHPQKVKKIDDLTPIIELYHHTVCAGRLDEALDLFINRFGKALHYQFGAYQLEIGVLSVLFLDGENKPPHLKSESSQAFTLNQLASAYSMSGQPRRAVPLFELSNTSCDKAGDKKSLAIGLGNLATQQLPIGTLRAAEANLQRYIALSRELGVKEENASAHSELGLLLAYRGAFAEAEQELDTAWQMFEKQKEVQSQSVVAAYRALRALLMARAEQLPVISEQLSAGAISHQQSAIHNAKRALTLAEEDAQLTYPTERDFIRARWLLGAGLRAAGQLEEAERHLTEALQRARAINAVDYEVDVLLEIARLWWAQYQTSEVGRQDVGLTEAASPDFRSLNEEVRRLAHEALLITERSGYVLQGADAHLLLAELSQSGLKDPTGLSALDHARAALRLAECDGEGYRYQVAYDEAKMLVEVLSH